MKKYVLKIALAALLLPNISTYAQVEIDVNMNVNHKVGHVSTFDRSKFITIHADVRSSDWDLGTNSIADVRNHFLNGYDVYLGRDAGPITGELRNTQQDPNRPGYVNISNVQSRGASWKQTYANTTQWHQYENRNNHVIAAQLHPFWPDGTQLSTGWALSQEDTAQNPFGTASGEYMGHYLKNYFGNGGTSGQPFPEYVEVINEPMYELVDWKKVSTPDQIFKYHNSVAAAIKKVTPNAKVGGWVTAFPEFDKNNFGQWNERMKKFIDVCGDNMDYISLHLYDMPVFGGNVILRKGGDIEATFDMVEQYTNMKYGTPKTFVISEFGATTHDYQGDWSSYRDWLHIKANNSMMMQFMERAHLIDQTVNYIMLKVDWGYNFAGNGDTWPHRLYRKANEPASYTGNWVYTDMVKLFELWKDVKGTRIDTKSSDLDVMVDAYVTGNKSYVIVNNLAWTNKTIDLNLFETNGLNLTNLKVKQLYLGDSNPVKDQNSVVLDTDNYSSNFPSSLVLRPEATYVLEYTYSSTVAINETSVETKYYADKNLQPISSNVTKTFALNGVNKGTYGEAILRIGVGRNQGLSLRPTVKVNGTQVVVPNNFRGDEQVDRGRFFGVLEVEVPFNLISANNQVEVTFPDNGGYISSMAMQVFNFSKDIRNTGDTTNPDTPVDGDIVLGNGANTNGTSDGWSSNMIINKTDTYTNTSGSVQNLSVETFKFYAAKKADPVTPFVVKVNSGNNNFTVLAVGTTRNSSSYNVGQNSVAFSNGAKVITLQNGETIATGFLDANANGTGSGSGSVIPFDTSSPDTLWYTGGANGSGSGSVSEGNAPVAGSNTVALSRNYHYNITFKLEQAQTVPVTGVQVNPGALSLNIGETGNLTGSVTPSNATDTSILFTSNNTAIATVNQSGVVEGVSAGTTTITLKTTDGGFTKNATITVNDPNQNPSGDTVVLGNGSNTGGTSDGWNSNMIINKTDTYTNNSGAAQQIEVETFSFYAARKADPVTPFIVKVNNGTNNFTVLAVGTTRTNSSYNVGQNNVSFSQNASTFTLQNGETIATGFLDANANGTGGGSGSVIPFDQTSPDNLWYTGGGDGSASGSVFVGSAPVAGSSTVGLNRNYHYNITIKTTSNSSNGPSLLTIEAEDFTNTGGTIDDSQWGGPGIGVKISSNGNIVEWANNGDYMDYVVNIPQDGSYEITYFISSPNTGSTILFGIPGTVFNTTTVPNNGSWNSFQTLKASQTAYFTAGTHVVRLTAGAKTWTWNLDKFTLSKVGSQRQELTLSADELSDCEEVRLYPNPVSDQLYIDFNCSQANESTIYIYNSTGVLMSTKKSNGQKEILDVQHLSSGIYTIMIVNSDNKIIERFVKN